MFREFTPEVALGRIAGAAARPGNAVRLLRDARENYPAWEEAIQGARQVIHFENFIFTDDATGRRFAEVLAERARAGVRVRFLYDWLGNFGRASSGLWRTMTEAGVEVRTFNPVRLSAPLWMRRDHRKLLTVDGRVGFVSGLCVSDNWTGGEGGEPEPWRDTGLSIEGPAVADLDRAFRETWGEAGPGLSDEDMPQPGPHPGALLPWGDTSVRVVAGRPGEMRAYRLDLLMAASARQRLWLTDAYFVPTQSYVQALGEATRAGVDVRLLVPGSSDVPLLQPLVRTGYRALIEAGVRVYEWNGSMLHAKTAVVDEGFARVGSTNLNPTSWFGNWELDVAVEDEDFAHAMAAMFAQDLTRATEIVPDTGTGLRQRLRQATLQQAAHRGAPRQRIRAAGLAGAALGLGRAAVAAAARARALTRLEARSLVVFSVLLTALAVLVTLVPALVVSPIVITCLWLAVAFANRAWRMRRYKPPIVPRLHAPRLPQAHSAEMSRPREPAPSE